MTLTPTELIANAKVDVSTYDTELRDGKLVAVGTALRERVAELVADGEGLAVCHGVARLLASHGLEIHSEADAAVARDYLESVFRDFAASADVASYSPVVMGYDQVAAMDVDGFNKNTSFTPNSDHTESREFLTTKCVHFDAATTFIGNVYGPNTNIAGGQPIICNTRDFLSKAGIAPGELIELMPHSYNVAVKQEYTQEILTDHAAAVDIDLLEDMVMVVLNNEVDGGLAHAGSAPSLADPAKPGKRPLRHIELQFEDGSNLGTWYTHYGLDMPEVKMSVPERDAADFDRYHRGVDELLSPTATGS
jgi:hypothetical protein